MTNDLGKRAIIFGISGQDGAYLAQYLLEKGYQVTGVSRDAQVRNFGNLTRLGIQSRMGLESASLSDFRSVLQLLSKIEPHEVYNLAGQTSVNLSFSLPVETFDSITIGTLNLLEAIRFIGKEIKLYNACSSECFGDVETPSSETTPFRPRSPYAVAKAAAFWQVANYREAYGLFACSGILFNHDSPLRPERFVTKKIVASAHRIAGGSGEKLRLGNLEVVRDWGWAPEYVQVMWKMLQQPRPDDFVVATGESHSLQEFVDTAFRGAGLDWSEHVVRDDSLLRPTDLRISLADPSKALHDLSWEAQCRMPDVVRLMLDSERESAADGL